jgi:hypothetical protein
MKKQLQGIVSLLVCLVASGASGTILSDNLGNAITGTEAVGGTRFVDASFGTDASSYSLSSVTLLMQEVTPGNAVLQIYTDSGFQPGLLVGTMTSPASYTSVLGNNLFTSPGIALAPNSTYWAVLEAPTGQYNWAWTSDDTGSGVGLQHTWGFSTDAGATWIENATAPQMMLAIGEVPEPSTFMLFGMGAIGLVCNWGRQKSSLR